MSRKNNERRAKRLAQEFWQPEDTPEMTDFPPKSHFIIALKRKGLKQIQSFLEKLPNTQYNAFWRVISFFVLKPKRDGKHRHASDEDVWRELQEVNKSMLNPYSMYLFKKKIQAVVAADAKREGNN